VLDRSAAAPLLSLAGLAVAAAFSLGLLFGRFDLGIGGGPGGEGGSRTPNPSVVFTPAPSPDATPAFVGTILFAQEGSIWSISGHEVRRISSGSRDSMPAWTSDGQAIVFIETRTRNARVPTDGRYQTYILDYPSVMRMTAAGTDRTVIKDGLIKLEGGSERYYFTWLLQPDVSPDGKTIALVSDAPKPFDQDVTLSLLPMTGGKVDNLGVRQERPLGHNDPDWSPDGTRLAFTYNARDASLGTPKVGILTLKGAKLRFLVSGGYAQPSWSPDGRFLAAGRTTGAHDRRRSRHRHRARQGRGGPGPLHGRRSELRPRLVAGRDRDRLSEHHQGRGRSAAAAARAARRGWRGADTAGRHRPHRRQPARSRVAPVVVHPARAAAHAVAVGGPVGLGIPGRLGRAERRALAGSRM